MLESAPSKWCYEKNNCKKIMKKVTAYEKIQRIFWVGQRTESIRLKNCFTCLTIIGRKERESFKQKFGAILPSFNISLSSISFIMDQEK